MEVLVILLVSFSCGGWAPSGSSDPLRRDALGVGAGCPARDLRGVLARGPRGRPVVGWGHAGGRTGLDARETEFGNAGVCSEGTKTPGQGGQTSVHQMMDFQLAKRRHEERLREAVPVRDRGRAPKVAARGN